MVLRALCLAGLVAACGSSRGSDAKATPETPTEQPAAATPQPIERGSLSLWLAVYHADTDGARAAGDAARDALVAAGWEVELERTAYDEFAIPDESYAAQQAGRDAVERIAAFPRVTVISGAAPVDGPKAKLTAAHDAIATFATKVDGGVWDQHSWQLFTAARWRDRPSSWAGDVPLGRELFTIQLSRSKDGARLVTAGLHKLGLPNLLLDGVPPTASSTAGRLLNSIAQVLIESSRLELDTPIELSPKTATHPALQATWTPAPKRPDRPPTFRLTHPDRREEDPNGPLVQIVLDAGFWPTAALLAETP